VDLGGHRIRVGSDPGRCRAATVSTGGRGGGSYREAVRRAADDGSPQVKRLKQQFE
jgi:hypothetical protein